MVGEYILLISVSSQQKFEVKDSNSHAYLTVRHFAFGEGNGTPLQHSCLENPMDGGAWWTTVHGVAKSWTRLSDFTFTFMLSYYVNVLENLFLVLKYMEISPGFSLEGLILKLKLQYFGLLM